MKKMKQLQRGQPCGWGMILEWVVRKLGMQEFEHCNFLSLATLLGSPNISTARESQIKSYYK